MKIYATISKNGQIFFSTLATRRFSLADFTHVSIACTTFGIYVTFRTEKAYPTDRKLFSRAGMVGFSAKKHLKFVSLETEKAQKYPIEWKNGTILIKTYPLDAANTEGIG